MVDRAKGRLWLFAGIVLIAAILWGIDHYWDWPINDPWIWLGATPDGRESISTTLRNVGLVVAGVIAFGFAYWRAKVADRQATAAQYQADAARLQSEISQRAWLDDRYERGANLLGSNAPSLRLGGVYALQRLAEEYPEQYHVQIMRLFCAFARHPTVLDNNDSNSIDYETVRIVDANERPASVRRLRPDVEAVIEAISTRSEVRIKLEREAKFVPQLSYADLRNLWLYDANFSGVQLVRANLSGAFLLKANFSCAEMWEADLSGARLNGANFTGARLTGAKLSSIEAISADFSNVYLGMVNLAQADLSGADVTGASFLLADLTGTKFYKDGLEAQGLTQRQFDFAKASKDDPPLLSGLIDSETSKDIYWDKRRQGNNK